MTFRYTDQRLHQELGLDYISSHVASTHLIGATPNIANALRQIRKNDVIHIKGFLINIQIPGETLVKTSLVRTDNWIPGQGNTGGSEFIYVTELQNGDRLFK